MAKIVHTPKIHTCSFCGTLSTNPKVGFMVTGPNRAVICEECLQTSVAIGAKMKRETGKNGLKLCQVSKKK